MTIFQELGASSKLTEGRKGCTNDGWRNKRFCQLFGDSGSECHRLCHPDADTLEDRGPVTCLPSQDTSAERQHDVDCFIWAFTKTVSAALPSVVSGTDPPGCHRGSTRASIRELFASSFSVCSDSLRPDASLQVHSTSLFASHVDLPQTGRHFCPTVSWAAQFQGDLRKAKGSRSPRPVVDLEGTSEHESPPHRRQHL